MQEQIVCKTKGICLLTFYSLIREKEVEPNWSKVITEGKPKGGNKVRKERREAKSKAIRGKKNEVDLKVKISRKEADMTSSTLSVQFVPKSIFTLCCCFTAVAFSRFKSPLSSSLQPKNIWSSHSLNPSLVNHLTLVCSVPSHNLPASCSEGRGLSITEILDSPLFISSLSSPVGGVVNECERKKIKIFIFTVHLRCIFSPKPGGDSGGHEY